MVSKRLSPARSILALITASCSLPWSGEKPNEVNIVFITRNNQIVVEALMDDRPGEFAVGSSEPRTVVDPAFVKGRAGNSRIVLGDRFAASVEPVAANLGGIVNGILGADVWRGNTLIIDYHRELVVISRDRAEPMNGAIFNFEGPPTISITIDGRSERAIVDLALPDTLVLPRGRAPGASRVSVQVQMAGHDFGRIDAGVADIDQIRVGNRLLSKFLLKIDYRRGVVSLWRDPRSS